MPRNKRPEQDAFQRGIARIGVERFACLTLWPHLQLSDSPAIAVGLSAMGHIGKRTWNPDAAGTPDYGRVPRINA